MAIFTRTNGDAGGVRNVDAGAAFANATIINTGVAAPITAYKVSFAGGGSGNLAAELSTGGAVETVLRIVSGNATILAYQVDAANVTYANTQQISILTERSAWSDATVQAAIRQTTAGDGAGNIGSQSAVTATTAQVTSAGGFKLI
jgi:hypothetical protein